MASPEAAPVNPFADILPAQLPYARYYWSPHTAHIQQILSMSHVPLLDRVPDLCVCSEENVWWLCRRLLQHSRVHTAYCLFISNPERRVLMLRQQAGSSKRVGLVVWDYHVVALAAVTPAASTTSTAAVRWYVLDVDSTLPFPCPLDTYIDASFSPTAAAPLRPLFRLIPAAVYIAHFASDRSHMKREDGSWYEPPPSWPNIQPIDSPATNNIQSYITMAVPQTQARHTHTEPNDEQYGHVLTMQQLIEVLSGEQRQTDDTGS